MATALSKTNPWSRSIDDLVVPLSRGATISGTVLDQNGEPVPGISIQLREYRWEPRGRELVVSSAPGLIRPISSDVRGQFRASGLSPGEYVVIARPTLPSVIPLTTQADYDAAASDARASQVTAARPGVMHVPLFHPNVIDPGAAETVRLAAGDEQKLHFQFELVSTGTVSGIVRAPAPLPATTSVRLTSTDQASGAAAPTRFGSADASGAFTISGVAPGRYHVTASIGATLSGVTEIVVNGDLSGVALDLAPVVTATVSGIVRADSDAAAAQMRGRSIRLSPLEMAPPDSGIRQVVIDADGRFTFPNVPAGRYRLEIVGGTAATRPRVSSQTVNGEETIERGLEVNSGEAILLNAVVTVSESRLSVLVRGQDGGPATTPMVLLFGRDPAAWTPPSRRIFAARTDQNGRSLFPDVPPGEYLLAIVHDIETGTWFNPQVLAALAGAATPVTVRRGDTPEISAALR